MKSTDMGYVNKNNQMNLGCTDRPGTDYNQKLYAMKCLDCGFKYFANGTDIWLRKCPKCQKGRKKPDDILPNAKSPKTRIPETYLMVYENYMRKKTGDTFCKITHNSYVYSKDQEGYKTDIAEKTKKLTEKLFGVKRDNNPKIEEILKYTFEILKCRGNLVNGHTVKVTEEILRDKGKQKSAAEAVKAVMCNEVPETAYEMAAKAFGGYKFGLLSYFFFVKDSREYLPVSPENFDRIFGRFGRGYIDCPKLTANGTWKTYSMFLQCISDIKEQLAQRYPDEDVSLLDVHSMLWIMGEKEFIDFYETNKDTLPQDIREKDSVVCAKARIGQGEYRKKMVEYWEGKCAVTGCGLTDILVASHAKPWKDCSAAECRDPFNGLLLSPNLDALFDKFLISFQDDGAILISDKMNQETRSKLGIYENMRLRKMDSRHLTYLQFHRNLFYKLSK